MKFLKLVWAHSTIAKDSIRAMLDLMFNTFSTLALRHPNIAMEAFEGALAEISKDSFHERTVAHPLPDPFVPMNLPITRQLILDLRPEESDLDFDPDEAEPDCTEYVEITEYGDKGLDLRIPYNGMLFRRRRRGHVQVIIHDISGNITSETRVEPMTSPAIYLNARFCFSRKSHGTAINLTPWISTASMDDVVQFMDTIQSDFIDLDHPDYNLIERVACTCMDEEDNVWHERAMAMEFIPDDIWERILSLLPDIRPEDHDLISVRAENNDDLSINGPL